MRTLRLALSTTFFAIAILFSSCDKNSNEPSSSVMRDEFIEPLYQIDDMNELESPDITEADEINAFKMRDSSKHSDLRQCERAVPKKSKDCKNGNHKRPDANPRSLPFILKQLNLDSAQKKAIHGFLKEHCDCLADHHRKAHDIDKNILKLANEKRFALLANFKAGEITKEQLLNELREIRSEIHAEMRNHNNRKDHIQHMKKCRENLFQNINTVLKNNQRDKFHNWLEKNKK